MAKSRIWSITLYGTEAWILVNKEENPKDFWEAAGIRDVGPDTVIKNKMESQTDE